MAKEIKSQGQWPQRAAALNPFNRARREWDNRMGGALVHARNWRLAAFAGFGLAALATGGVIYATQLPRMTVHVVEVDAQGEARYRGPAGVAAQDYEPSDAVLSHYLRRVVEDMRSITSDIPLLKRRWTEAYAFLAPPVAQQVTAHLREHNPFERAARERVTLDFLSTVPIGGSSWQLDWRETVWSQTGAVTDQRVWRGVFQVKTEIPTDFQRLAQNPLGLSITELSWTPIKS